VLCHGVEDQGRTRLNARTTCTNASSGVQKQLKLPKKQLKWEAKRARQNRKDQKALECDIANEQAEKRLMDSVANTVKESRTIKTKGHKRATSAREGLD
jgi:hypothetical protein